ncbi:MAG: hypothetical protein J0L88_03745 [Xanthomonadales bacterium]|nr:hypothetical protein [Xanthomonadales bacterium]
MPPHESQDAAFVVVMNAGSGRNDASEVRARIEELIRAAGRTCAFEIVEDGRQMPDAARRAAQRVRRAGGTLVACGGDGTINAVAAAALAEDVALGILPQGTFNYFGRAHGIPSDVEASVDLLLRSTTRDAQVGLVNGHPFLVNASVGLYPQVLEDREAWKQRFGRRRIVALWSGLATLLGRRALLDIEVGDGTRRASLRTLTLLVGNNPLQFDRLGLDPDSRIGDGELVAVSLRPIGRWAMLGLIVRGALGTLGEADSVDVRAVRRLTVDAARRRRRTLKVAVDGELLRLQMPLVFEIAERPLRLLAPQDASAERDPG